MEYSLMEYSVVMSFMRHTPDHRGGGPVHITNQSESVVKCADLSCVVRGTGAPIQSESVQAVTAGRRREAEGTWG